MENKEESVLDVEEIDAKADLYRKYEYPSEIEAQDEDFMHEEIAEDQSSSEESSGQEEKTRTFKVVREILLRKPELRNNFEVVGKWVWCNFDEKPSEEIRSFLAQQGFRWNKKRQVWQNPCGLSSKASNGNPKDKYPVFALSEL